MRGEVARLAPLCRFRDCQHLAEPGCAIKEAMAAGIIHPRRLEHFRQTRLEGDRGCFKVVRQLRGNGLRVPAAQGAE